MKGRRADLKLFSSISAQVLNVDLRRFNLVLMDCRKHGGSEGGDVETFSFEVSGRRSENKPQP